MVPFQDVKARTSARCASRPDPPDARSTSPEAPTCPPHEGRGRAPPAGRPEHVAAGGDPVPDGTSVSERWRRNSDVAAHHDSVRTDGRSMSQALLAVGVAAGAQHGDDRRNLLQRRAATISATPPSPATSVSPAPAARRSRATTATRRSWASEHCIATHPSDLAGGPVPLDAIVRLARYVWGVRADRSVTDFHL